MRRTAMILAMGLAIGIGAACDDDDDPTDPDDIDEFSAQLTPEGDIDTDASGRAEFDFDGSTVEYEIELDDATDVIAAHIHIGTAGTDGPIAVTLFTNSQGVDVDDDILADGSFDAGDLESTASVTFEALLTLMANGGAYVNVHTLANPGGEIRGQLTEDD